MLQFQDIHPLIHAGFITGAALALYSVLDDQLRHFPRVLARAGEVWPTHRGKARAAARRRASARRRRLQERRAIARGHLPRPAALSAFQARRADATPPPASCTVRGGGGGIHRGDAATTPTPRIGLLLSYRGYRVELVEWERRIPGMCWIQFASCPGHVFLVDSEDVVPQVGEVAA